MSDQPSGPTRRRVLEAVGGSLVASGATGLATATPGDRLVRANIGYSRGDGRQAALDAAEAVVHDFAFDAVTLRVSREAMAGLARRPDVRYVEEDGSLDLLAQTESWGYTRIDADEVNDAGHTGSGIDVAVLDTGIDPDHQDLAPNLGAGKGVVACSGTCSEPWADDEGHGTNVAGIVGAVDDTDGVVGVAPDATLHAVKVCNDDEDDNCFFSAAAEGLEWVADQGYDVANMSIGGGHSDALADAIDYAHDHGVMLVAAAGNDGECTDCVVYPGNDSLVTAVSATDVADDLTNFSSQGHPVAFAAPGITVDTTSRGGGEEDFSGTSASSPHVAGALAALMSGPYSGPEALERLRHAAEDVGLGGTEQGYGLVDLGDTFELAVETTAAFPGTSITTLRGDLVDVTSADSAECYFEYKRSSSSIYSDSASVTRSSPGLYDVSIATTTDTTYDFRAVAEFSDGTTLRGDVLTFRTPTGGGGGTE